MDRDKSRGRFAGGGLTGAGGARWAASLVRLAGLVPGYLGSELGPRRHAQLGEDVPEMGLHCPARNVQAAADLRIGP